jgi:hypothetical protein
MSVPRKTTRLDHQDSILLDNLVLLSFARLQTVSCVRMPCKLQTSHLAAVVPCLCYLV